jgi:hypothetical protein
MRAATFAAFLVLLAAGLAWAQCPGGVCPIPGSYGPAEGFQRPYYWPAPQAGYSCSGGSAGQFSGYYPPMWPPSVVDSADVPFNFQSPGGSIYFTSPAYLSQRQARERPGRLVIRQRWR